MEDGGFEDGGEGTEVPLLEVGGRRTGFDLVEYQKRFLSVFLLQIGFGLGGELPICQELLKTSRRKWRQAPIFNPNLKFVSWASYFPLFRTFFPCRGSIFEGLEIQKRYSSAPPKGLTRRMRFPARTPRSTQPAAVGGSAGSRRAAVRGRR